MSRPLLIGLAGRMGSGKSTLAGLLAQRLTTDSTRVEVLNFASPLKEAAKILFGLNDEQLCGAGKDLVDTTWGTTPRHILQTLATDYCKVIGGQDFFVRHLATRVFSCEADYAIIDDVRYPNEIDYIKGEGGQIVYLEGGIDSAHESETSLPKPTPFSYGEFRRNNQGATHQERRKAIAKFYASDDATYDLVLREWSKPQERLNAVLEKVIT